jgi:hypothetical protein
MPSTHPLEKLFEPHWIAGGASESAIAEAEAAFGSDFHQATGLSSLGLVPPAAAAISEIRQIACPI